MNDKKRSGLGRGLAALLEEIGGPSSNNAARETDRPTQGATILPISEIRANPKQPRRRFDDAAMDDLIASVKTRGLVQPILVRPVRGDVFEIVAGERRWRAAQAAQLHEVPVIIRHLDDRTAFEIALIENIQRADLNPIEEALGYERLREEYGHTQDGIAAATGKSRSHIANLLRLLTLPSPVLEKVQEGTLSMGHARALVGHFDRADALAEQIIARGLSVRETEALVAADSGRERVARPRGKGGEGAAGGYRDPDTVALERALSESIGLKVSIDGAGQTGRVVIDYATLDQLDMLAQRLSGGRF